MSDTRPRILVVEDERPHQLIVEKALGKAYALTFATSLAQARELVTANTYDIFLFDIMLPDGEGYDILTYVRNIERFQRTPVIFLTAREDLKSKLLGFSLGGDDYVTKPCEGLELRARIDAKLRLINELKSVSEPGDSLLVGDLRLDLGRQVVSVAQPDGSNLVLDLTPIEFRLLLFFAKNGEASLSRQQILVEVWGPQTFVLERSVDSYVAALRRKLGPLSKMIKSVHGVGYRFVVQDRVGKPAA